MSGSESDDAELVTRCLAADEEAWTTLVGRYADYIYALAVRGFRFPREDAEEVLQETMVQVYEHLGDYRGAGPLRAWIGAVAANVARQRLRSRSRHPESSLPQEASDAGQQQALDAVEEAVVVRAALAGLEAPCREVLNRFFALNQKYAEISKDMGIPEGTVASRIARCLTRLRQVLGRTAQSGKK
jgi:RNA polymerase sigma factor (sigma-70 family)